MKKLIALLLFLYAIVFILGWFSAQAQTTAVLTPVPKIQFLDVNGNPLASGKLFSYQAGTTTPQSTFTDSTAGTPNANPLILDAGGFGNVWLGSTNCYKLILQNALGVQQWSVDNICPANLSGVSTITSTTANPATSGFIRMANTDCILWRNTANSANIGFCNQGAAATGTGNLADVLKYGDSSHGGLQAQRFLDTSAAPAQSGVLATGNNVAAVVSRNAAGNADITAVKVDASNITDIGGSAGALFAGPVSGVSTISIGAGTALATSNQTGTGSLVLSISPSITTPISTSPTINTGVSQGSGFKHQRFGASCTTAASVGAICNTTYTWTTPFADTNYTVVCTGDNRANTELGVPTVINIGTVNANNFLVSIAAFTAVAAQFPAVDCIGIHD